MVVGQLPPDGPRVQAAGHGAQAREAGQRRRPRRSRRPPPPRRRRATRAPPRPSSACRSPRSPRRRAAAEAAKAAEARRRPRGADRPAPRVATPARVVTPAPAPVAPRVTPPGVAPSATPAPMAASTASATKTIFGVPAPKAPEGFVAGGSARRSPARRRSTSEADSARTETARSTARRARARSTSRRRRWRPPAGAAPPARRPPPVGGARHRAERAAADRRSPRLESKSAAGASPPTEPAAPVAAEKPRKAAPRDAGLDLRRRGVRLRPGAARHLPARRPARTLRRPTVLSAVVDAYRRTRKPKDILWNKFVARPLAAVLLVPLARDARHARTRSRWLTLLVFLAGAALLAFRPGWGALCAGVGDPRAVVRARLRRRPARAPQGDLVAGRRAPRLPDGRAQGVRAGRRGRPSGSGGRRTRRAGCSRGWAAWSSSRRPSA